MRREIALVYSLVSPPNEKEFAVFTHVKEKVYTDFEQVREEIELETNRLGGKKVLFCKSFAKKSLFCSHTEYLQRPDYIENLFTKCSTLR